MGNAESRALCTVASNKFHDKLIERSSTIITINNENSFVFKIAGLGYIPNDVTTYINNKYRKKDTYRMYILINRIIQKIFKL